MPVNTQCIDYQKKLPQWTIVRDCVEGQLAIKDGGINYLPRPAGQSDEDYINYKNRTVFFDATSRTAEGLHGHLFAKDPVQSGEDKISDTFKNYLKDVDASGTSLDEFVSDITWDDIQTNWGGILVDHVSEPEDISVAEKKGGAFLKWYPAESIYNYKYSVKNGAKRLSKVVLREDTEEEKPDDEFKTITIEMYRVLSFDEFGNYIQRKYKKDEKAEGGFSLIGEIICPKMNGKPLDFIPFYTCPGEKPEKSMLLGLAFENIGHYQKTAEYENGLFLTSFATPIAVNMEQPTVEKTKTEYKTDEKTKERVPVKIKERVSQKISLGASAFKFFLQRNADGTISPHVDVKYLEFSGAGLTQLLNALNACLDRMAKLGIQAIGSEKKGVETAEVAQIHRSSEHGVLGAFSRSMSDKITQAVRLKVIWDGIPEEEANAWSYELPTKFNFEELSAQILAIMHSARQSDEIPRSVWFAALKKHGMIPESMTYDSFLREIEKDNTGGHGPNGDMEILKQAV